MEVGASRLFLSVEMFILRRYNRRRQIAVCGEDYVKIEKDEITIRDFTETDLPLMFKWDFTETDLPLMFKWLTDKRVLEYYEGRDVRRTLCR